ncbi:MAG: CoA transferase [Gammaproteobacteria bacterium]|nr:CoA transferase [Gammaproteobacteria bacterium]
MAALSHLKILDFSTLLPGPFGTLILADLGADVLRIESPDRLDISREMGPKDGDASYVHRYLNRNKRSIALDLKIPEAIEVVKQLIMEYDILVEQFRPGVMEQLGLGFETLKAINPKLIYCSLTGYGQTGPSKDRAGHDINYLAIAGIPDHSRREGSAPVPSGIQIADIAGGSMFLVTGLLAAVIQRTETGKGQHIDVSITDAVFTLNAVPAASFLGANIETGPESYILNGQQFYDYYETSDGRYFSVGSLEPKFLKTMCEVLNKPELLSLVISQDLEQNLKFKKHIAAAINEKTFEECCSLFSAVDACVEPVLTLAEACKNEQLLYRDMIVEVDGIKQIGCAIKMSESEPQYQFKGCSKGKHNKYLITAFNYTEDNYNQLVKAGVFEKNSSIHPDKWNKKKER